MINRLNKAVLKIQFFILFFLFTCPSIFSQFKIVDLSSNSISLSKEILEKQRQQRNHIQAQRGAVTLPFIDDFSNEGPYPNPSLWMDDFVYINRTNALNPPSIGMASFEGLDPAGAPYGGPRGRSDYLTSMPVDMMGADASKLYLTFYLQAGNLTLAPTKKDSFGVEFKDQNGKWNTIKRYTVNSLGGDKDFVFFEIQIDPEYIYDNFQFRFYNISDNNGFLNVWNLDYVRLKEYFQSDRKVETDIAFSNDMESIFKEHYAVPIKHLKNNLDYYLKTSIDISIRNSFNAKLQADPSSLSITEINTGNTLLPEETLLEVVNVPVNQRDLDPGLYQFTNPIKDFSTFKNNLAQLLSTSEAEFFISKNYEYNQTQESNPQLLANNSISKVYEVGQIFAYDDGTAEKGIEILKAADQTPSFAIEYEALVDDTIQAISINLPHAEPENEIQTFQLVVWGDDLNAEPLWRSEEIEPRYLDDYGLTNIQGFTVFRIRDENGNDTPIFIPAGKFHVGWTQVSVADDGVLVGYDLTSTFGASHIYYTNGDNWIQTPLLGGSIMIQPVLSGAKQFNQTATDDLEYRSSLIQIQPNPVHDYLNIDYPENEDLTVLEIVNSLGQVVLTSELIKSIFVGNLPKGKYIVNLKDNKNQLYGTKRFIRL